jgi:hypothetical protein
VTFIATIILYRQYKGRIMDNNIPFAATIGGGFPGGILLGYAMKKVIRITAVVYF